MNPIPVAAIQRVSKNNLQENLQKTETLIKLAVNKGARLIVLPENFAVFSSSLQAQIAEQENTPDGPIRTYLSRLARQYRVWLVGGTIPIADNPADKRPYSSCLVFNAEGEQVARYNKIHLFDVSINDAQQRYAESETYQPGDRVVTVPTPFGLLGVAVCYDLRFPELFRIMFQRGVDIIALPAAFTKTTGRAHWMTLIRARCIENSCFMIAADQGGKHSAQRETFGHSCVVNAWGDVLSLQELGEGAAFAVLDFDEMRAQRVQIPVAEHQRFIVPSDL